MIMEMAASKAEPKPENGSLLDADSLRSRSFQPEVAKPSLAASARSCHCPDLAIPQDSFRIPAGLASCSIFDERMAAMRIFRPLRAGTQ
jgi:hypothetical protein